MNWLKRIFSGRGMAICPVCNVYFDPRRHYTFVDDRFREYCDAHRKEKIAEENEKVHLFNWVKNHEKEISFFRVNTQRMKWLVENWPKFEKQFLEFEKQRLNNGVVILGGGGGGGGTGKTMTSWIGSPAIISGPDSDLKSPKGKKSKGKKG